ncbi:hypothetical protein M422DRAFT_780110 [Sphaerobolus stellatus SS14]|uniref:F-box domain-containing protein n=1 Tax=Sphaerobolus stellatus (strain SS14) TaxID=990650 RepID=A0A0C9VUB1_SPHS4|nr:hypothetical protein M422DRAFT_780110 [Sphaerobolus stellatus SS14]
MDVDHPDFQESIELYNQSHLAACWGVNNCEMDIILDNLEKIQRLLDVLNESQQSTALLPSLGFEQQRAALELALTIGTALLSPIRKLFPEILSYIFLYCLPELVPASHEAKFENLNITAQTRKGVEARKNISLVCRQWQAVLMDCPDAWANIPLIPGFSSSRRIQKWFDRSKNAILYLAIDAEDIDPKVTTKYLKLVRTNSHRIRRIYLSGWTIVNKSVFPDNGVFPCLQACICGIAGEDSSFGPISQTQGVILAPQLRYVEYHVGNLPIKWLPTDHLPQITHFRGSVSEVTNHPDHIPTDLEYFPLRACTSLKKLNWRDLRKYTNPPTNLDTLSLPVLTYFKLEFNGMGSIRPLLNMLDLPSLVELSIHSKRVSSTILIPLLGRTPNLRKLSLLKFDIWQRVLETFGSIPMLQELRLHKCHIASPSAQYITLLCPMLDLIYLDEGLACPGDLASFINGEDGPRWDVIYQSYITEGNLLCHNLQTSPEIGKGLPRCILNNISMDGMDYNNYTVDPDYVGYD